MRLGDFRTTSQSSFGLSDGREYSATIVGIRYGYNYTDSGSRHPQVCFVLAILNNDNQYVYNRSVECNPDTLHPDSNFARILASLLNCSTSTLELGRALRQKGWLVNNSLETSNLLGLPVRVRIELQASRKGTGNPFPRVVQIFQDDGRFAARPLPRTGEVPNWIKYPYKGEYTGAEFVDGWNWEDVQPVQTLAENIPCECDIPF